MKLKITTTPTSPLAKGGLGGINLYIARMNRLAARRRFYDALWDAVTMVVVAYLSMLFAYWLFGAPMSFANKSGLFRNCSQIVGV